MSLHSIIEDLLSDLAPLRFAPPVRHVYNPLRYARRPHDRYLDRYGQPPTPVLLLGMNPGPWGMAQTGVPFGDVGMVRDWLDIQAPVGTPANPHPRRPVQGFDCGRGEVSGRRLWGWARDRFQTPENFFARFFVANYCPLVFLEESGRNRTPDRLPAGEKAPLFAACDRALVRMARKLSAEWVIGVGRFAERRARTAIDDSGVRIGGVSHPSPASPKANKGWSELVERELAALGVSPREGARPV
jgi:single-strand selective monofunctional uracil DNA glycosylase